MTLGWGIIGIGHFADISTGPALKKSANAKLIAVCSRSLEKARAFSMKHGAEKAYDSYEQMLKNPDVDVVYIATPNYLHAPQAIQAAGAGKHVLCEKPMALTVAECERMIEACEKNGVKLGVGFPNRYHPAHLEARRCIASGMLGEISLARSLFCRGGTRGFWKGWKANPEMAGSGALAGQAIHPIDLLRFLLQSEVREVRALTDEDPPHRPVDEMVYAILRFENGVDGVVVSGVLAPRPDNELVLYGSRAKLKCKETFLAVGNAIGELTVDGESTRTTIKFSSDDPPADRLGRVIDAFTRCIEENTDLAISGHNGLQMVRIASAIQESSRSGRPVRIG